MTTPRTMDKPCQCENVCHLSDPCTQLAPLVVKTIYGTLRICEVCENDHPMPHEYRASMERTTLAQPEIPAPSLTNVRIDGIEFRVDSEGRVRWASCSYGRSQGERARVAARAKRGTS